jgi:hypothetical protein
VDKRLDEYLRRLDESDVEEAATDGSRTKNLAEKIEALREKRGRYGPLLCDGLTSPRCVGGPSLSGRRKCYSTREQPWPMQSKNCLN